MATFELKDEDLALLTWLKENGAIIDKVQWPATSTVDGVRGAVATTDIDPLVPMFEIPTKLMMSPVQALQSKELGELIAQEAPILVGDMITILFLMHERGKGSDSFWWPFIRTLPVPGTIMDWCEEELQELQHDQLTVRCLSRSGRLRLIYENMFMHDLAPRYPLLFPHESTADGMLIEPFDCWWDFEHFKHAHGTIQARAFGRRLPWTALVPFADLLNHANVQTKYELACAESGVEDGDGFFRLFPSGSNCYKSGEEVFNSYGRRPNDNLLLEYGFSILDNMWDNVDIGTVAGREESADNLWTVKRQLILKAGLSVARPLRLTKDSFCFHLLTSQRILCLEESEIEEALIKGKEESKPLKPSAQRRPSVAFVGDDVPDSKAASVDVKAFERLDITESNETEMKPRPLFGTSPISVGNERKALIGAAAKLDQWMKARPTSISQDEEMLKGTSSDDHMLLSAIRYRLTRKRIVAEHIRALAIVHKELNRCALAQGGAHILGAMGIPAPPAPPIDTFDPMIQPAVSMIRASSIFSEF